MATRAKATRDRCAVSSAPKKARRADDAYMTPPALADYLVGRCLRPLDDSLGAVLEPSAGSGNFVRAVRLREPEADVTTCEIRAAGAGWRADRHFRADFLTLDFGDRRFDTIVGNPPYSQAEAFIRRGVGLLEPGGRLAFLLRLSFLESARRIPFWREFPAASIYVLSERPSFTGGGTDSAPYAWFVWAAGGRGPARLEVVSWRSEGPG